MTYPRIAIVGAGPAGLTTAVILHRHGWQVSVFDGDASPDARDQGGTLDLHPGEGLLALAKAGLLEHFMAVARHEDQEQRVVDALSGEMLREDIPEPGSGTKPEIDRTKLRGLLLAALDVDAVRWGSRVLAVSEQGDGRYNLQLDGTDEGPFDLVIGADGAWSRVRVALTDVQPKYSGVTFVELWMSDVERRYPASAALVGHGTLFSLHAGKGIIAQRNGDDLIRIYAAFRTTADETERPDKTLRNITKGELLDRFTGWSPALRNLISDADRISAVRPIVALPPNLRWKQRVGMTLIGDAAHVMPPLGTGVNLAMLDAAELAEAIAMSEDWKSAVLRSSDAMLERAEAILKACTAGFQEMFSTAGQTSLLEHFESATDDVHRSEIQT